MAQLGSWQRRTRARNVSVVTSDAAKIYGHKTSHSPRRVATWMPWTVAITPGCQVHFAQTRCDLLRTRPTFPCALRVSWLFSISSSAFAVSSPPARP